MPGDFDDFDDHVRRASEYYDAPDTLRLMRTAEMFSEGFWHTEFTCEHPELGVVDENRYLAARLGISESSSVLDFSCGVGGFCKFIVEKFNCQARGLNISHAQIDIARAENSCDGRIKFYTYDGHRFPFDEPTFDRISSQETLCHVPNRPEIFGELFRVLKPGGAICIQDWFKPEDLSPQVETELIRPIDEAWVTKLGTLKEYATDLAGAGFVELETISDRELPGWTMRGPGIRTRHLETLQKCFTIFRARQEKAFVFGFVFGKKP